MEDPVLVLRDRTGTTRLLILASLNDGGTLSSVAQRLGITVQAVSAHVRSLATQGFAVLSAGAYQPTPKGLQFLHEGVRQLRDAVNNLAAPLDVIQVASAIAGSSLTSGQEVGLWMANGDLEAWPISGPGSRPSPPSRGRVQESARLGDEVIVAQLRGVVRLEPGRLRIVALPAPSEGGIARVDTPSLLRELGRDWAKIGAHGTGASILARQLAKRGLSSPHFEFAADRAAFNAAERGLATLLFVTRDRLPEVMQAFERLNAATLRRVPVELVEAPELRSN